MAGFALVTAGAVAAGAVAAGAVGAGVADDAPLGASVFANRCAVCHGAQAAGIPGVFPALRAQIAAFGKSQQGRDYLVMVVSAGLAGDLKVAGSRYSGVMPPQSGLSEAQVAAVLSYLASDLGRNTAAAAAIVAQDVIKARARHPNAAAQDTRALRPGFPES